MTSTFSSFISFSTLLISIATSLVLVELPIGLHPDLGVASRAVPTLDLERGKAEHVTLKVGHRARAWLGSEDHAAGRLVVDPHPPPEWLAGGQVVRAQRDRSGHHGLFKPIRPGKM